MTSHQKSSSRTNPVGPAIPFSVFRRSPGKALELLSRRPVKLAIAALLATILSVGLFVASVPDHRSLLSRSLLLAPIASAGFILYGFVLRREIRR